MQMQAPACRHEPILELHEVALHKLVKPAAMFARCFPNFVKTSAFFFFHFSKEDKQSILVSIFQVHSVRAIPVMC